MVKYRNPNDAHGTPIPSSMPEPEYEVDLKIEGLPYYVDDILDNGDVLWEGKVYTDRAGSAPSGRATGTEGMPGKTSDNTSNKGSSAPTGSATTDAQGHDTLDASGDDTVRGELADDASKVLMKVLYGARMARYDLLRAVCALACRITKWDRICDKKLHRLMCYIWSTKHFRQYAWVGDTRGDIELCLFTDADFAGDPATMRSTSILRWWT